ncbi:MAG: hypothetical protein ACYCTH_12555 [Cellulomonas sp.]
MTSTVFTPSDNDRGMLSTLRASLSSQEAHRRRVEDLKQESVGTWGIRVGDATDLKLECVDDACLSTSPDDHASIDFTAAPSKGAMR